MGRREGFAWLTWGEFVQKWRRCVSSLPSWSKGLEAWNECSEQLLWSRSWCCSYKATCPMLCGRVDGEWLTSIATWVCRFSCVIGVLIKHETSTRMHVWWVARTNHVLVLHGFVNVCLTDPRTMGQAFLLHSWLRLEVANGHQASQILTHNHMSLCIATSTSTQWFWVNWQGHPPLLVCQDVRPQSAHFFLNLCPSHGTSLPSSEPIQHCTSPHSI